MRAIATVLISLALCVGLVGCKQDGGGGAATSDDMSLGSATAKVTIIEYASLGCPICAKWNNEVFPAFKTKYIDTGKVHYVLREQLTGDAPVAAAGFLLARCVGKDKYFDILDTVFRQEADLLESDRSAEKRAALVKIAQSAGMSEDKFNACVENEAALKALNDRSDRYAKDAKITGTPTFVVNGKTYDKGFIPLTEMDAAIAEALAKPAPAAAK